MRKLKLEIEPRPVSTWGITLANRLPRKEWDEIRQRVYREANYTCQICGSTKNGLHCHEKWGFDDKKRIQRLLGFECCCEVCHDVHHLGRSRQVYSKEYVGLLIKHWCQVNGKTEREFRIYEAQLFEISKKRVNKFYIVKVGRRILT